MALELITIPGPYRVAILVSESNAVDTAQRYPSSQSEGYFRTQSVGYFKDMTKDPKVVRSTVQRIVQRFVEGARLGDRLRTTPCIWYTSGNDMPYQ